MNTMQRNEFPVILNINHLCELGFYGGRKSLFSRLLITHANQRENKIIPVRNQTVELLF